MSQEIVDKYQPLIGNDYEIKEQLGNPGGSSIAFSALGADGQRYVLKVQGPNSRQSAEEWAKTQSEGFDIIESHFQDFNGEISTPQQAQKGSNFVIEKYLGIDIDIAGLAPQQKERLAKQLAEFLAHCHSQPTDAIAQDPIHKPMSSLLGNNTPTSFEQCLDYLTEVLSEQEQESLSQKIEQYNTRDQNNEPHVLVHSDIRSHNLLHNKEADTFAVIDFDRMRVDNIYADFCGRGFTDMLDVLWPTIDEYNKISNHQIDPSKVRLFHGLGIVNEFCHMAITRETPDKQEAKDSISRKIAELNNSYNSYIKAKDTDISDNRY